MGDLTRWARGLQTQHWLASFVLNGVTVAAGILKNGVPKNLKGFYILMTRRWQVSDIREDPFHYNRIFFSFFRDRDFAATFSPQDENLLVASGLVQIPHMMVLFLDSSCSFQQINLL